MSDPDVLEKYWSSRFLTINTLEEIRLINLKCYVADCLEKVSYDCKCSHNKILMCENHIASHFKEVTSEQHILKSLKHDWDISIRAKLVNYIKDHNSDLKILKLKIQSKVQKHLRKIKRDMDELLGNIDSIMNENDRKLLDLIDNNPKTFEDLSAVSQLLQSKFQNSSALICVKFEIPHECFDIIQAEVCDWNLPKADRINTIPHIPHKLLRELLLVNNREECEEIKIFLDKFCDKPLLQWCDCQTNQVHYLDWNEYTEKTITIIDLIIPENSRSISIDQDQILLCGGEFRIPEAHFNLSQVYKINVKTPSFEILASMNTERADFCMTCLNGFYYALGGVDYQENVMTKCERYSLENNGWQNIADLNNARESATCVSVPKENCIYLIGGKDRHSNLIKKIEKYDAKSNKWTVKNVKNPILSYYLGSCLLPDSNLIVIFGGRNSNEESLKECYFYDHFTNQVTFANQILSDFNDVDNMSVVFGGKIYSYFSKIHSELKELSIYDIRSGVWSVKS